MRTACGLGAVVLLVSATLGSSLLPTSGPREAQESPLESEQASSGETIFDTAIAPLLAQRCLECHDAASRRGGLNLAHKQSALAGGNTAPAIVPGEADKSLLWLFVQADVMPKERTPLSPREKDLLRRWIEDGAHWSSDTIDPATFARNRHSGSHWVQRLTVPEYIETVRRALGVDIEKQARELLPPDLRADGFSNTAYNLNVDLGHVEAYARLAEIIAQRMDVVAFAARYSDSQAMTDPNMRPLIAEMGKWLLRGPLEEHEIAIYRGISTTVASAGGGFEEAVRYVIEAMLQSPRFIYRIETQRGDGTMRPAGEYELASRLSYILWGGPPDRELMRAADAGELSDRANAEAQVRRMVQDPRAIARSVQFVAQWLNLDRLDNLRPNPDHFPDWDPELARDMRTETLEFFKHVAWKDQRPLADLFNAQMTYLTPRLAKHYRLPPKGQGLKHYDLVAVPERGGLLTQGSVLTVGGDEASMVARGLFILRNILRGTVNDPPPGIDTTPVPTEPGLSKRAIAEMRVANSACGGCHARFEPLAFGLEKFDGLGSYHERDEHANELRHDGEILIPGESAPVAYESSAELMDLLARSDRVSETITWKLAQFALGRPLGSPDVPFLAEIHNSAQQQGGTYASVMTAIAMGDLVRMTRTEAVYD